MAMDEEGKRLMVRGNIFSEGSRRPQPYLSLPFARPGNDGKLQKEHYFNGGSPTPDTYWKIDRLSTRHIRDKSKKHLRMRLNFYSEPVAGSEPVREEWVGASGIRITVVRRRGQTPQYEYTVEPV